MIFWLLLLATAVQCQDIEITNMPKGTMWCGASFNLKFKYSATKVPAGSVLRVRLSGNAVGSNNVIAELGTVIAPGTNFTINLPQPLPATWFGAEKLNGANDGASTDVLFEIVRADKPDVSSYCSFCVDDDFKLRCCPLTTANQCGCVGCSCASRDQCATNLRCNVEDNKCLDDLPGNSEKCPDNQCLMPFTCACLDASSSSCADKFCIDKGNCPASSYGTFGCPCGAFNQCDSGLLCREQFCSVNPSTPIAQQKCKFGTSTDRPDACMLHPASSSRVMPFSCQEGDMCKPCVPGDRFCLCDNANGCSDPATYCIEAGNAQRCMPRLGCVGCPCLRTGGCTDGDVNCVDKVCKRNIVTSNNVIAPTMTTTAPVGATIGAEPTSDATKVSESMLSILIASILAFLIVI